MDLGEGLAPGQQLYDIEAPLDDDDDDDDDEEGKKKKVSEIFISVLGSC
jgi:hypothetical protein